MLYKLWSDLLHLFETKTGWWRVEQTALATIIGPPYDLERKWNIVNESSIVPAFSNEYYFQVQNIGTYDIF